MGLKIQPCKIVENAGNISVEYTINMPNSKKKYPVLTNLQFNIFKGILNCKYLFFFPTL